MPATPDVIVVGAGSAGSAVAARLVEGGRKVLVLEAGPTDAHLLVKIPFGLVWLMGSRRDWAMQTVPQAALNNRQLRVPRGKVVGGSGSINSMVWFRGSRQDYDDWALQGWSSEAVWEAFEAVEARLTPARLPHPHPLSEALGQSFGANVPAIPTPERESAGVFSVNLRNGRRWSAADAYLRPALATGQAILRTGVTVTRVAFKDGRATGVVLSDGSVMGAAAGVVLAAGAVASPAILMRSGLGPAAHLQDVGIDVIADLPGIGANLHDHPAIAVHHAGPGSGYGLEFGQIASWARAPFDWLFRRQGRLTSNTVEAGAFLRLSPGSGPPEAQIHFLPAMLGWQGRAIAWGAGYVADIGLCQPASRGTLRLTSPNARAAPLIDPHILADPDDMTRLVLAFKRLRQLLREAPFGPHAAPEAFPGPGVATDAQITEHIRARAGTAYHPVGTVAMGTTKAAPLTPQGALRGVEGLWVADASNMPKITSANTNAPSMMIGHRIGGWIADHLGKGA